MNHLVLGDSNLAALDLLLEIAGVLAIDLATDRVACAEDLKDGSLELLGEGAATADAGDAEDVIEGDAAAVLD